MCSSTQPLQCAHIDRKDHETTYYFQHPHNLLVMCENCHGRYDSMKDPSLYHDVVKHRKIVLQHELLIAIDGQVAVAKQTEAIIAPIRSLLSAQGPAFWRAAAGAVAYGQLANLSGSLGVAPPPPAAGTAQLYALSASLAPSQPLAAAKVASLVSGLGTDAEAWDHLDDGETEPWLCDRGDGAYALVESAECPKCGEQVDIAQAGEEPTNVAREDGQIVAYFDDGRDDTFTPECPQCGHTPLDFSFQSMCSYCEHMTGKDD